MRYFSYEHIIVKVVLTEIIITAYLGDMNLLKVIFYSLNVVLQL